LFDVLKQSQGLLTAAAVLRASMTAGKGGHVLLSCMIEAIDL
jgi:hypothetical protein